MPLSLTLHIDYGDPWPWLAQCPALSSSHQAKPSVVDVTALAIEEDAYGNRQSLGAEDLAFLAGAPVAPALLPEEVLKAAGRPALHFAGVLRPRFFGWIAFVAKESRGSLGLSYLHERGDWPYETASWSFGSYESLTLASYDGRAEPLWEESLLRRREPQATQGFFPFETLLRDRKREK